MNNQIKQISLTLQEEGSRIVRGGRYSSKISSTNKDGSFNYSLITLRPPVYTQSVRTLSLGNMFIDNCVEKPPNQLRISPKKWKSLPVKTRIRFHCEEIAKDLNAFILDIEFND